MTISDPAALNRQFGRVGQIAFEASPLGGTVAVLAAGGCSSTVALQGAQVLDWRANGRDLVWLSRDARLGTSKAPRGGIPVCWPWFGSHPSDSSKPSHGFARHRTWSVAETQSAEGSASITLAYRTGDDDRQLWPHQASVRITVSLGHSLSLTLETTNLGDEPFELTEALHTYFRVGDIDAVRVEGLDGRDYLDKVENFALKRQTGVIRIDREVDRIYLGDVTPVRLVEATDPARAIVIESTGSRSAVVWNPWFERTEALGDMGAANAFRQMLCIETANAGEDVVRLEPGARHVLAARYSAA